MNRPEGPARPSFGYARAALRAEADPAKAAFYPRFFQTQPGGYAEGDRFLGVTVPMVRSVARRVRDLSLRDVERLLRSPYHEERLLGLLLLVDRHRRSEPEERLRLARRYLAWKEHVNNWDLVDASAPYILGPHLDRLGVPLLRRLARSPSVWDRRIAVLATFHEIRAGSFARFFGVAEWLRQDDHDLIQKAVGWMLREVGKRDREAMERFLRRHQRTLPRTTLRYAIERLPPARRRAYLEGRA